MFANDRLTENFDDICAFLTEEREKALTEKEWAFRMRGYGYRVLRTGFGIEVARLPQNRVLGLMQA